MPHPSSGEPNEIGIWVNPPDTQLPLKHREVRFAIGTPSGWSTNSWKVWVRKQDTYIACRDNFREMKVSLHASGIWRLGFIERFAEARPDLVEPEEDRVWKKWKPDLAETNPVATAFQVIAPTATLYLSPQERLNWPSNILFVEPPRDPSLMTVVSIAVVLGLEPVRFPEGISGAVVGLLPLTNNRTVQLVATYDPIGDVLEQISSALRQAAVRLRGKDALPSQGVIFVTGDRGVDTAWVSTARFQREEGAS
jgi:hypothetical protein